jgi:trehalose 6-phosphate synthase/phosphatase
MMMAKECCACCLDNNGVLILSQFAGAAEQLKRSALLAADAILKAFRMSRRERSAHMKRMRRVVSNENLFRWVDSFLTARSPLAPLQL